MPKIDNFLDNPELIELYRKMVLIRKFEEKCAQMYLRGNISGFTHLYIGEEAVAVGTISALFDKDYIVSAYRDHGHALAKGSSPKKVMAELFGKATGLCRGLGGSMHLFDQKNRFMGGYAIVGGGIPIAVGIGMSINYKDEDLVCVCFFGDGAVNEGAFHEGMNLAKLWNLPVLFVCENNYYGMGTSVNRASSVEKIYKRACSYDMPSVAIDGMDVIEVRKTVNNAVKKIRRGSGPYFIEMQTYRYRPHSMADPDRYRTPEEESIWKDRDPIEHYARRLITEGIIDTYELSEINENIDNEINEAVEFSQNSPEPSKEMLYKYVYAE